MRNSPNKGVWCGLQKKAKSSYVPPPPPPSVVSVTCRSGGNYVPEGQPLFFDVVLEYATAATVQYTWQRSGSAVPNVHYDPVFSFSPSSITMTGNTFIVPPGVQTFTVVVSTINDGIYSTPVVRTFSLTVADKSAMGLIAEKDLAVYSITGSSFIYEGSPASYTVSCSALPISTTVPLVLAGQAQLGIDYTITFLNGVTPNSDYTALTVPLGTSSFNFIVYALTDTIAPEEELLSITIGTVTKEITLREPPLQVVSVTSSAEAPVPEGTAIVYTVQLSRATDQQTLLPLVVSGTAVAGVHYNPSFVYSDQVTFDGTNLIVPVGVSSFTITVQTIDDEVYTEPLIRTLILTISDKYATGQIAENDIQILSITATPAIVYEGYPARFYVTCTPLPIPVTTSFDIAGTLSYGTDYSDPVCTNGAVVNSTRTAITIPANVAEFIISILIIDDDQPDITTDVLSVRVKDKQAIVQIKDDDALMVYPVSVSENWRQTFMPQFWFIDQAYSLQRLVSDPSRPFIRVRRSSDNAETDIGFTTPTQYFEESWIDTTALLNFVGSANGYVVKWYNQAVPDRTLISPAPEYQPLIVVNGNLIRAPNSRPAILFPYRSNTSPYLYWDPSIPGWGYSFSGIAAVFIGAYSQADAYYSRMVSLGSSANPTGSDQVYPPNNGCALGQLRSLDWASQPRKFLIEHRHTAISQMNMPEAPGQGNLGAHLYFTLLGGVLSTSYTAARTEIYNIAQQVNASVNIPSLENTRVRVGCGMFQVPLEQWTGTISTVLILTRINGQAPIDDLPLEQRILLFDNLRRSQGTD